MLGFISRHQSLPRYADALMMLQARPDVYAEAGLSPALTSTDTTPATTGRQAFAQRAASKPVCIGAGRKCSDVAPLPQLHQRTYTSILIYTAGPWCLGRELRLGLTTIICRSSRTSQRANAVYGPGTWLPIRRTRPCRRPPATGWLPISRRVCQKKVPLAQGATCAAGPRCPVMAQ